MSTGFSILDIFGTSLEQVETNEFTIELIAPGLERMQDYVREGFLNVVAMITNAHMFQLQQLAADALRYNITIPLHTDPLPGMYFVSRDGRHATFRVISATPSFLRDTAAQASNSFSVANPARLEEQTDFESGPFDEASLEPPLVSLRVMPPAHGPEFEAKLALASQCMNTVLDSLGPIRSTTSLKDQRQKSSPLSREKRPVYQSPVLSMAVGPTVLMAEPPARHDTGLLYNGEGGVARPDQQDIVISSLGGKFKLYPINEIQVST